MTDYMQGYTDALLHMADMLLEMTGMLRRMPTWGEGLPPDRRVRIEAYDDFRGLVLSVAARLVAPEVPDVPPPDS
jgi:hypothetical protein